MSQTLKRSKELPPTLDSLLETCAARIDPDTPPPVFPAAPRLGTLVERTTPWPLEDWQWIVADRLEKLTEQTGQRVLIHGPPQFGKSIVISQRFPSYVLGKDPLYRLRLACYNFTHARRFSKVNLEIMRGQAFREMFPDPRCRVPDLCSDHEWSTAARAAVLDGQASFMALGLRSGFTGVGVDTLVIDDPYKNAQEAFSETIREGIWEWWTNVVLPRLNPATNVVVMFHRWHSDDLAGRLIAQGGWELLRFPAIGDGGENDPTNRKIGETLSRRYSPEYLRGIEAAMGSTSFLSLYQGRPVPLGGNLFKEVWFGDLYKKLPTFVRIATFWDTAIEAGEENDLTACVTIGEGTDGYYYILRALCGRWETPDTARFLVEQAAWMRQTFGAPLHGGKYHGDYVEGSAGGKALLQYLRRTNPDLILIEIPNSGQGDKVVRAHSILPMAETRRIRMPDPGAFPATSAWRQELMANLCAFPAAKHDDLTDAFVHAVRWLMGLVAAKKGRRGRTRAADTQ